MTGQLHEQQDVVPAVLSFELSGVVVKLKSLTTLDSKLKTAGMTGI